MIVGCLVVLGGSCRGCRKKLLAGSKNPQEHPWCQQASVCPGGKEEKKERC